MSLLKRIEQGSGQTPSGSPAPQGTPAEGEAKSRLSELQARRVPVPGTAKVNPLADLKSRVQNRLLSELDPTMDITKTN